PWFVGCPTTCVARLAFIRISRKRAPRGLCGGSLVLAVFALAAAAGAQVKIGVTVSATGPAASLGIPERNTVAMCPKEVAGKSVEYIVLDDASDTTTAVQNTRK